MKLIPHKIYLRKQVLLVCLISLLVLASQLLAGAHASEHVFHETDASCIMFSGVEKLSTAGPGLQVTIRDYRYNSLQKKPSVKVAQACLSSSYLSRAPPLSF